jgi:hypothetical protein
MRIFIILAVRRSDSLAATPLRGHGPRGRRRSALQSLQSHQLRTEQHREPQRRPLKADGLAHHNRIRFRAAARRMMTDV